MVLADGMEVATGGGSVVAVDVVGGVEDAADVVAGVVVGRDALQATKMLPEVPGSVSGALRRSQSSRSGKVAGLKCASKCTQAYDDSGCRW